MNYKAAIVSLGGDDDEKIQMQEISRRQNLTEVLAVRMRERGGSRMTSKSQLE